MKLPPLGHLLDGLWTPLHDRTYWRLHTVPHLIGGAVLVLLLLPLHLGWRAVYVAGLYQALRQEVLRELDPPNYPVWAMLWDIGACSMGAVMLATLLRNLP